MLILVDSKLILKTANQKLSAFIRVASITTDFNQKVIFNSWLKISSIIVPDSGCLALQL